MMFNVPVFHERALCAENGPDDALWFPDKRNREAAVMEARRVCGACPARAECLVTALSLPGIDGIWAGTTEYQRGKLRAKRRRLGRVVVEFGEELQR